MRAEVAPTRARAKAIALVKASAPSSAERGHRVRSRAARALEAASPRTRRASTRRRRAPKRRGPRMARRSSRRRARARRRTCCSRAMPRVGARREQAAAQRDGRAHKVSRSASVATALDALAMRASRRRRWRKALRVVQIASQEAGFAAPSPRRARARCSRRRSSGVPRTGRAVRRTRRRARRASSSCARRMRRRGAVRARAVLSEARRRRARRAEKSDQRARRRGPRASSGPSGQRPPRAPAPSRPRRAGTRSAAAVRSRPAARPRGRLRVATGSRGCNMRARARWRPARSAALVRGYVKSTHHERVPRRGDGAAGPLRRSGSKRKLAADGAPRPAEARRTSRRRRGRRRKRRRGGGAAQ